MENASNFGQKVITDKVIVSSSDDLISSIAKLKSKIYLVKGQKKVELLVKNANIVNVFSGEIHNDNVAIADGIFVGFGHTEEYKEYDAQDIIDVRGRFMCPGLIDGHIHLESTFLVPREFCSIVDSHVTSAVICDPP